jgi:hypothetical protein
MAVNWSGFQQEVAAWFDDNQNNQKTEQQTAFKIAFAYHKVVQLASITTIPGSKLISTGNPKLLEQGIFSTINQMKLAGGAKPTPIMFLDWANAMVSYWSTSQWVPVPPPPGYVAPTTGHQTLSGGVVTPLNSQLYDAFAFPPQNTPMGNIIASKLVIACTQHLTTIQGIWNGTVPTPSGPVPGPPFPWVGLI